MNSLATLYYPSLYAAGAALALGGGVFAMLSRETAPLGLLAAIIGIGAVVATMLVQFNARRQRAD